jgi:hypothetical protein
VNHDPNLPPLPARSGRPHLSSTSWSAGGAPNPCLVLPASVVLLDGFVTMPGRQAPIIWMAKDASRKKYAVNPRRAARLGWALFGGLAVVLSGAALVLNLRRPAVRPAETHDRRPGVRADVPALRLFGALVVCCGRASRMQTVVMRLRHPHPTPRSRSAFVGFCFPPDVIVLAVPWYLRFSLSLPRRRGAAR